MLCTQCLRYHNKDKLCEKIQVQCKECGHKQKTINKYIREIKCGVCNKKKLER